MHCASGYPLYRSEAYSRAMWYGVQYYSETYMDGAYAGHSGNSGNWENLLVARMNRPSPMTATMWGTYNPTLGTGRIYAKFRNDSSATISGNLYFLIVRDSVYYRSPNGDVWHNYVAQDYLPNQNGSPVTVAAGDTVTQYRDFSIPDSFDISKCMIYAWIQRTSGNRSAYQSSMKKVSELGTYITEQPKQMPNATKLELIPNPCVKETNFLFDLPATMPFSIKLFDVTGRQIKAMNGVAHGGKERITWNCRDDRGTTVNPGVYFYSFSSGHLNTSGKIVVK